MENKANYFYKEMPDKNFFVDIFENIHTKKGITFDTHWHEHLQFFYFTKGKALMRCNLNKINVEAGDFIIINSNELHYCENLCENLAYYIIRVDLSFLFSNSLDSCQAKFMTPLAQNLILFKNLVRGDKSITTCADKMIGEYLKKEVGFELAIKSCIYELIVLLIRGYVSKILTQKEFDFQTHNSERFMTVIKYIGENFSDHLDINSLASMSNMSSYHFCRLFKQITGKSPINYVNHLRLEKATELFLHGDYTITEIALRCGFSDANYFSRLYKKYKHISPIEIKNSRTNS